MERPSMSEWFEVLNLGLNELLKCGNLECGSHYSYNNLQKCPFCKTEPGKITKIQMRRWEEIEKYDKATNTVKKNFELQEEVFDEILLDKNTPKEIISLNFVLPDTDSLKPLLQVELIEDNENKVLLKPQNNTRFKLSNRLGIPHTQANSTTQTIIDKPKKIRIADSSHPDKQKYMLHLQDLNTPQRVLTID
jgi:hypothetical protein